MQIDWWTLAFQTVNFMVVVWLLSRFLYQPVRRIIEEREAAGAKAMKAAQEKADAAEAARAEYQRRSAGLAEAQHKEETAYRSEMSKERDAVLQAAHEQAEALLKDARDKVARERAKALEELKETIADLAVELASKALAGVGADAAALLEDILSYLDGLSEEQRSDLVTDLANGAGALEIVSAVALGEKNHRSWRSALEHRFGGDAQIVFKVDPELIGGVELRFPHAELSFSVAARLHRLVREMPPRNGT